MKRFQTHLLKISNHGLEALAVFNYIEFEFEGRVLNQVDTNIMYTINIILED